MTHAVWFAPVSIEGLRARVAADMPRTIDELERLVRIPSLGYPGYDPANVRALAEATREILVVARHMRSTDADRPAQSC